MKRLLLIVVLISILLFGVGYILYNYLGGVPIGFHNGKLVMYYRSVSILCPECSNWDIKYFKINSEEACKKIKGRLLINLEFGGYYGCAPINFW